MERPFIFENSTTVVPGKEVRINELKEKLISLCRELTRGTDRLSKDLLIDVRRTVLLLEQLEHDFRGLDNE